MRCLQEFVLREQSCSEDGANCNDTSHYPFQSGGCRYATFSELGVTSGLWGCLQVVPRGFSDVPSSFLRSVVCVLDALPTVPALCACGWGGRGYRAQPW